MAIKNVVLVGANGHLGPSILHALITSEAFNVSVLSRESSKSTYPESVTIIRTADKPDVSELAHALKGQDAIVCAFSGSLVDEQYSLADAAKQAGLKRFIPADFGSCDSSSEQALRLVPLYEGKKKVREYLEKLASEGGTLSWTSLVSGHFLDYGLQTTLLGFNSKKRHARIFDGGDVRFSATTLATIGTAVVRVLQKEDETKNRMLYIQSLSTSQNEILKSMEKATGPGWTTEQTDSKEYINKVKAELDEDPKNPELNEDLVSVVGIVDAMWEKLADFSNELLGVGNENLDEVVAKAVK
jgi:putative NADH-flavin reductase